ncbi:acyl-CoA synthetase [Streptosporangium violaceochromogenes]|nr:acyl-CoA synthetase [Streptosporangium violaceochromogenes]
MNGVKRGVDVNLVDLQERIAEVIPDRESIVWGERRFTWRETNLRTRRIANALLDQGLGAPRAEGRLSHQQHAAVYMRNRPEYVEAVLGSFKARLIPFNVNYRYTRAELQVLFADADPAVIFFQSCFAETLRQTLATLGKSPLLVQVDDDGGTGLVEGAHWFHDLLARGSAEPVPTVPSPDDGYLIYTGGTTGMPKGVLWRQADIFVAAMGGRRDDFSEFESVTEIVDRARGGGKRFLPLPPFMHGGGLWLAFYAITGGHTVVIQSNTRFFDPIDAVRTVERENVDTLVIAGTAFARPLLEALDEHEYDVSSLTDIHTGGAGLLPELKRAWFRHAPDVTVSDMFGSSEGGGHLVGVTTRTQEPPRGTFTPVLGTTLLAEDLSGELPPTETGVGWVARRGRLPLGYLNDPDKTASTFPTIGGTRYAIPGDRGRWTAGGRIEVLGRDSTCVNSGGEKIYVEEVERVLLSHSAVYDVLVVGTPDELLGECVAAVVQFRPGSRVTLDELRGFGRAVLASYKLPRRMVVADEIRRSPAGKADYGWARRTLLAGLTEGTAHR